VLNFVGVADELTVATDADVVVYAPTNAAMDAFAKELTGNPKATAKDLLQPQYFPVLAHVVASHITDDDDDDGVYKSFGGQSLLAVEADDGDADDDSTKKAGSAAAAAKYEGTVAVLPSKKITANILREEDLGDSGDLYVIDRVLKPDDVFLTPAQAFKADPELSTYYRLITTLAPEFAKAVNDANAGTTFAPTNAAIDKYLASIGLTEAKLLAANVDPKVKARAIGTLLYHFSPGVGLDADWLAQGDWTLPTALVVGPGKPADGKLGKDDVVKTLKAGKNVGKNVVKGDLSSAKMLKQVYAGADVIHKVDAVLVPDVGGGGAGAASAFKAPTPKVPSTSTAGRKLLRSASPRNQMLRMAQRAAIVRAFAAVKDVERARMEYNAYARSHPTVPKYYLSPDGTGGYLV
jgi:hypothetical protein